MLQKHIGFTRLRANPAKKEKVQGSSSLVTDKLGPWWRGLWKTISMELLSSSSLDRRWKASFSPYVVGLDPLFLLWYDKKLYDDYVNITTGKSKGPYAPVIANRFSSKFVFSDTDHGQFIEKFEQDPEVFRVFNKKECRIYQIGKWWLELFPIPPIKTHISYIRLKSIVVL